MNFPTIVLMSFVHNKYLSCASAHNCPMSLFMLILICCIRSSRSELCFGQTHRKCCSLSTTPMVQVTRVRSSRSNPLQRLVSMRIGNTKHAKPCYSRSNCLLHSVLEILFDIKCGFYQLVCPQLWHGIDIS